MTERPLSITTQNATPIQVAFDSTASTTANDAPSVIESAVEDDSTIRCICDYTDDDGNTIFCEECKTWQHIECYYPGKVDDASSPDFDHTCVQCSPKVVDNRAATERQRIQRQNKALSEGADKKPKRPPSKSHKKKSKPTDLNVNGYHDDPLRNGSPQDHPPAKKPKGHRSHQSISSHQKRSPSFNARPHNHGHPPSPAHTPPDLPNNFSVHSYSESFLTLYENDENTRQCSTNSFDRLDVSNSMSLWLHDPRKLKADTSFENKDDVFGFLTVDIQELKWPELRVKEKESIINDRVLHWKYLITPTHLSQQGRIGELNGVVGFQKDYCGDPDNHWQESAHPRPFVFFHPRLPLFIDTRNEGSELRYARRSCRANTNLETFIANKSEYHFWFVTERSIAANEQITIPWDFRFPSDVKSRFLNALKMGEDDGAVYNGPDISDEEYEMLSQTILTVLSDHGGCACDLGKDCSFARFHRTYHGRSHSVPNGGKSKKGRKTKQNHVSPTSTGHATNSRAASEGQDQFEEDDNRSISGSARSKPQSRDLTPAHAVGETNGIPLEQSDREKRKLAMVEDTFKKMEQQVQPPRKKKRPSDGVAHAANNTGTTQSTPKPRQRSIAPRGSIPQAPNLNGSKARHYVDASLSTRQSGSPFSAISPTAANTSPQNASPLPNSAPYRSRQSSVAPKPTFTSSSTQTDDDDQAWYMDPKPKAKRKIIPLAKKLLRNRQRIQAMQNAMAACAEEASVRASPPVSMDLDNSVHDDQHPPDSPTDMKGRNPSISSSVYSVDHSSIDVPMTDVPTTASIIKPPPPWPTPVVPLSHAQRSPELRVQMPVMPSFSMPNLSGTPSGSATPSSATGSIVQSPFGTTHFPGALPTSAAGVVSHPKTTKKLSLGEYRAARMKKSDSVANKSSGGSPTVTSASLKSSLSTIEEAKSHGVLEGSPIVGSPMVDTTVDPLASMAGPTSGPTLKNNIPLAKPNGTL
jgi:hypothetical protein